MSAPEPRLLRRPEQGPDVRWREAAMLIEGSQGPMVGVLTLPAGRSTAALLMVAGQPQTRAGSHRMFTDLARQLSASGIASLRFDIGGWGDSPGEPLPFERSDRDVAAAAAALQAALPPRTPLWLWGLCDGASAAVLALPALRAAGVEPQVLCLVNPWVRSEASLSAAMVKTYYARRLMDREFWSRLLSGKVPVRNLVVEPLRHLGARLRPRARQAHKPGSIAAAPMASSMDPHTGGASGTADLPELLCAQLMSFRGEVLTVLSGKDLTAGETDALMRADKRWRKRLDRKGRLLRVPGADHTFSNPEHWSAVGQWIAMQAKRLS